MIAAEWTETVTTPEGFELRFGRAAASERMVALAVDLLIILVVAVVLGLVMAFTLGEGALLLLLFLLRQGYFTWFETRWNGRTPGKRIYHLRVVRADGGPLTVETLLARNLTREVELFLPLTLLAVPDALFADHVGVVRLVASLWILLLLFFPLTNAHRLRIGDLLAGTRVVVSPRAQLLRDLADARPAAGVREAEVAYRFTSAQLSIYGEQELSVLEDVLRKAKRGGDEVVTEVTRTICRRIDWTGEVPARDERTRFLRAFYAAQRQHLEQQLLLGRRRLRKGTPKPPPLPPAR